MFFVEYIIKPFRKGDAMETHKMIVAGSIVTIYDFCIEEEITYKIVSTKSANEQELSVDCALAKALLGKTIGAQIIVPAEESYKVQVVAVDNSAVQNFTPTD